MDLQPTKPRDAAALIVLDASGEKVLWARRNPTLKFLGGFQSFPGGRLDKTDPATPVKNCTDAETAALIACGVRETFEETGILLVRNGERLTKGQLPLLHDDLIEERSTFAEILDHWGLWIDAADFSFAGVWTTPVFSRIRFRTTFFVVRCPAKQEPYAAISELQEVEFVDSASAVERWSRSDILAVPPVLSAIQTHKELRTTEFTNAEFASKCADNAAAYEPGPHIIELNSRLICFPVRTKTLPPATHTNCYIAGGKKFVVIDAATPFPDEQERLIGFVSNLIESGNECAAIIVSHLHPDHFGGETVLRQILTERFGVEIPIAAHPITIESLKGMVAFDEETPDSYVLKDRKGTDFRLDLLLTPGHARGHLCFYDKEYGFLLSSDNVVGTGTVVVAPPEGNMIDYLHSLEEMRSLPGLRSLSGSHGSAVSDAKARITSYIEHRLEREQQVLDSISDGNRTVGSIVKSIYTDLDPLLFPLAEKSVEAHIDKLVSEGRIKANIGTKTHRR